MIIEIDWNDDGTVDIDLTGQDIAVSVGISEDTARKLWHDLGEMLHEVKEVETVEAEVLDDGT